MKKYGEETHVSFTSGVEEGEKRAVPIAYSVVIQSEILDDFLDVHRVLHVTQQPNCQHVVLVDVVRFEKVIDEDVALSFGQDFCSWW